MITAPKRRWLRFGLRTMLATVVIIAIPLAWIANERRQSKHEQQIAQQLELSGALVRFGGRFDTDYPLNPFEPAVEPTWWRKTLSRLCGPRVQYVAVLRNPIFTEMSPLVDLKSLLILGLDGSGVTDFERLADLHTLQTLSLNHTQIKDLTAIAGLGELDVLWLSNTPISDVGPLANLTELRLLSLSHTNVTDLTPIVGLKNLKMLDLRGTALSEPQLNDAQKAFPNCKIRHELLH